MTPSATNAPELSGRVDAFITDHAASLIGLSEEIRSRPELGYGEEFASERVTQWLAAQGLTARRQLAVTGLRVSLEGRAPGPRVALLGELDAVHVPSHPEADAETGAAHACGHHASLAAAAGATAALSTVMAGLDGGVDFIATPAEELLPGERLLELRRSGQVKRATGKGELIDAGVFDDIDLAMMVHTGRQGGPRFSVGDTLNGALRIRAEFSGSAAHGGSSPWLAIDAAQAARIALSALDAQRATFPDEDNVRIAARLSQPAAALGTAPAECTLEVLVRARSLDALAAALVKVDRALYAGSVAIGTQLTRTSELIYAPLSTSNALDDVVQANAIEVVGHQHLARGRHLGAGTDMGDLGLLMPVSHPYASGSAGHHHSATFAVIDHEQATLEPARYLARTVVDLLTDGARLASEVMDQSPPRMTREQYHQMRDGLGTTRSAWPSLEEGISSAR